MKKKSLLFFALALVLSLCLALVACADKNGGVKKLTAESGITLDGVFENSGTISIQHLQMGGKHSLPPITLLRSLCTRFLSRLLDDSVCLRHRKHGCNA